MTFFLVLVALESAAQEGNEREVMQLSGIVLGEDSVSGVFGAHIYVPKSGRGSTSNQMGYFSLPVLVGDSVVISCIGYKRRHYIVPRSSNTFLTIIVEMIPDITFLEEVEIVPFPTEEVFKEAILTLNIPSYEGMNSGSMNMKLFALMQRTSPMGDYANYRYYMDQQSNVIDDRFRARTNPLLDVFNWVRFFRELKQKKKKKN